MGKNAIMVIIKGIYSKNYWYKKPLGGFNEFLDWFENVTVKLLAY